MANEPGQRPDDASPKSPLELIGEGKGEDAGVDLPISPRDMVGELELDAHGIDDILGKGKAKFVGVIGAVGSGKTTLLASIFYSFLKGRFAGAQFSGSRTLPAFARVIASISVHGGVDDPEVPRTERGSSPYKGLHLRLMGLDQVSCDYIFTDVTGDLYQDAQYNAAAAKALGFLRRSDIVLVLLSGDMFLNRSDRETDFARLRGILKRLMDVRSIAIDVPILLLMSKHDRWKGDPAATEWSNYAEREVKDLGFTDVTRLDVAALSRKRELDSGFAVDEVLTRVMKIPMFVVRGACGATSPPPRDSYYESYRSSGSET